MKKSSCTVCKRPYWANTHPARVVNGVVFDTAEVRTNICKNCVRKRHGKKVAKS